MDALFSVVNRQDTYQAELTIDAADFDRDLPGVLCFSLAMPLNETSLTGGELIQRQGDWHRIRLHPVPSGPLNIQFSGSGSLRKGTDYPHGAYLEQSDKRTEVRIPAPGRYTTEPERPMTGNALVFIPSCRHRTSEQQLDCPATVRFIGDLWNCAWLQRLFDRLSDGVTPTLLNNSDSGWAVSAETDVRLSESFELSITEQGATLTYRDQSGFWQGQAFLFQYLLQWAVVGRLPACVLSDSAGFQYRGIHLDVVRHFFAASDLKRWWDVLALFQFNVFHWHLTDDDGWRLQSQRFPELTDVGAWRGPEETLPPQMGTGAQRYGGYYSAQQATDVVRHLAAMGIEVVPEMDLPGHARALLMSLPELVEVEDQSVYQSVQHYSDNVINPVYGETLTHLISLTKEWCELFPGPLFHLGCDEVPDGAWTQSPAVQQWQTSTEASPFTCLLQTMEDTVRQQGKALAGWQEIAQEGGVSKAVWVYSWQGVEAGQRAAEQGHPVVMLPAQYCYLDLAVTEADDDPGYNWAGVVNLKTVYQYQPLRGLSRDAAVNIQGVQYCLWTELLDTADKVEFMWFPRILAGAEVAWGSNTRHSFADFEVSADHWVQLLHRLGVGARSREMTW